MHEASAILHEVIASAAVPPIVTPKPPVEPEEPWSSASVEELAIEAQQLNESQNWRPELDMDEDHRAGGQQHAAGSGRLITAVLGQPPAA